MIIQRTLAEILEDLPPKCIALHPSTNSPILIVRGKDGYRPVGTFVKADKYNARHNVSHAQREAMLAGSMFGWGVPGSDPLNNQDAGPVETKATP